MTVFKVDPKEKDPKYKKIIKEVTKEVEEMYSDEHRDNGLCYKIWSKIKHILKEKYKIDWKTPAEMNPDIDFD